MANIYRHGDLLIQEISTLPKGAKRSASKTLAEGEVTGHHHTFTKGDVVLYTPSTLRDGEPVKYFEVKSSEASLTHQEHKEIKLPEGTYQLNIEREYNPMDKVIRQVMD